ncbi:hypothetical protein B0I18_107165 [Taibaiella chishuiensis]|uniref:Uncharacterized protein n=1 Tax=Taibaiella chishuiensis TaxID=1434707 RepID=A0A2P8D0L3_9BACT|nr:hypothetical protein B0I18_107165 [Taibaiella chishuiensis]
MDGFGSLFYRVQSSQVISAKKSPGGLSVKYSGKRLFFAGMPGQPAKAGMKRLLIREAPVVSVWKQGNLCLQRAPVNRWGS